MQGIVCIEYILCILSLDESSLSIVTMDNSQSQPKPNHTVLVQECTLSNKSAQLKLQLSLGF